MENEKKSYKKPETKEEAVEVLKSLSTEIYGRMKGRFLGLIEKWYPTTTNRAEQQIARDQFLLALSGISSSITRKIEDVAEVLNK